MTDYVDYEQFCKEFDIADNAIEMRYLLRWNGRRVGKENLAEHTHLVVACVIKLYEELKQHLAPSEQGRVEPYRIVKAAMLHDALEILRGDILNITKNKFPQIRQVIENEEMDFEKRQGAGLNYCEWAILDLADTLAALKFIKNEMDYGSNSDLVHEIYTQLKESYDKKYEAFIKSYCNKPEITHLNYQSEPFSKGYAEDAGCDVILKKKVTFLPMSTTNVDLNVKVTPEEGKMAFLCARTSAAARGLSVAMCPIDPNYNGTVTAIVHNVSNNVVEYDIGEAFCQVVSTPLTDTINRDEIRIKKKGKRTVSKLGGTGI